MKIIALALILFAPVCLAQQSPIDEGKTVIITPKPPAAVIEAPLTEREKRELLLRLTELVFLREKVKQQAEIIKRDEEQDKREADLNARELKLMQDKLDLSKQELAVSNQKAENFQKAYEDLRDVGHHGIGCTIKKIVSIGLWGCG